MGKKTVSVYFTGTNEQIEFRNTQHDSLIALLHEHTVTDDDSTFKLGYSGGQYDSSSVFDFGGIFTFGLQTQVNKAVNQIKALLQQGHEVQVNACGFSRGGAGVYLLCKTLNSLNTKKLKLNLIAFEPVPGNPTNLAMFPGTMTSVTRDLSASKYLKKALVLFTHKPMPSVVGHTPLLPKFPKNCEVEVDITYGCHKDANTVFPDYSKTIFFDDKTFIAFKRMLSTMQSYGTEFNFESRQFKIVGSNSNLDINLPDSELCLIYDKLAKKLSTTDAITQREMHSSDNLILSIPFAPYLNLQHQKLSSNGSISNIETCQLALAPSSRVTKLLSGATSSKMLSVTAITQQPQRAASEPYDIVIVGAGPVGLWTAIQIKLLSPNLKILILEKYKEYKRSHVLLIDKAGLSKSLLKIKGNPLHKFVDSIPSTIRTLALEEKLLELAKENGIEIKYQNIDELQDLVSSYQGTKLFIGADGAHSLVRQEIFSDHARGNQLLSPHFITAFHDEKALDHAQDNQELNYIVELKYEVNGTTRKADILNKFFEMVKENGIFDEHVGKHKEGKTPVTLRFFVDKDTYEKYKHATFKNPLYIDAMDNNDELYKTVRGWLDMKASKFNEEPIKETLKISTLTLGTYRSKHFIKLDKESAWCLVGDAAFGVPFFRSLNNGLLCGTELGILLAQYFQDSSADNLYLYNHYVEQLCQSQIATAANKSKLINKAGTSIGASHASLSASASVFRSSKSLFGS